MQVDYVYSCYYIQLTLSLLSMHCVCIHILYLYVMYTNREARLKILKLHVTQVPVKLSEEEWDSLVQKTEGFSGSDIATCAADAVLQPVRELESSNYWKYDKGKLMHNVNSYIFNIYAKQKQPKDC